MGDREKHDLDGNVFKVLLSNGFNSSCKLLNVLVFGELNPATAGKAIGGSFFDVFFAHFVPTDKDVFVLMMETGISVAVTCSSSQTFCFFLNGVFLFVIMVFVRSLTFSN